MGLVLTIRNGDSIWVGEAKVTFNRDPDNPNKWRAHVDAPKGIAVDRDEVRQRLTYQPGRKRLVEVK